ncbi:hypothetical protein BJ742DRAFT_738405 [Cladochytrium replicatum]|nr:hypothetical protein BJ742DRAFT_738405 [Cladochytrium replicatum]
MVPERSSRIHSPLDCHCDRGNTGIGLTKGKALLSKHAKVYLPAHSPTCAKAALDEIKKEIRNAKIEFMQLDLGDLKHVKEAAIKFVQSAFIPVFRRFLLTPQQGALTQLYAATSPEIETKN